MKKALSYILLFAYSTIMLIPVLPYVSDAVAHTFWLYEHISTVHYEHGKYHTHYEAVEITKKTGSEKGTTTSKYTGASDEHFITGIAYNHFQLAIITKQTFTNYQTAIPQAYLLSDFPPPKA